jgi:two-component system CheB/CheR fusion protein
MWFKKDQRLVYHIIEMKAKKNIPKIPKAIGKRLEKSTNQFPVVGIGASAGGLDAFKKLLKAIPEDSGMAYVLVQHLDPKHESMLPELLQKVTTIPVMEIADDIKVLPDHIYIIPSNKMLISNDGVLELTPRPEKIKNERNLPIDLFFTSLAEVHQSHAIGVVLSGTASDGTMGLKAIKDHGGITFAQDEASAAYEGMPHSAAQAGVVDFILPPEKIPQKLLEVTSIINGKDKNEEDFPQQDADVFKQMLSLLRIRKGTDFTYYKQTTIRRRILRRMAINKNAEPAAYLKFLRENKKEQDILYQDLLIPVTGFFRDPKTFDNLCESVFPHIIKNKPAGESIRVWVAGCSTGEEAYSIAICLKEFLGESSSYSGERVQIFATDISEPAITKARAGIYTKNNIEGLTPQRLQEFFTKTNEGYQANKSIRDMCVFAVHNFLKDPPFGKMDFISCRNVLIYMEPYLQKKALTTFHYSLNPKGFLLLGKSETTGGVPELYTLSQSKGVGKPDKLFTRKDVPGRFIHTTSQRSEKIFADVNANPKNANIKTDFQKTADDIMLSNYTPAGVVVNEAMDIVHFRGSTGNYLQQSPGKPSHNLLKMAKEGLAFELRNILHKTKKVKVPVIKENIPVKVNGIMQHITIEALQLPDTIEPHYLVLFHEKMSLQASGMSGATSKKKGAKLTTHDSQLTARIQQLEKELAQSREDMRSITEDQEAANEELQSANEELLSSSEELQSLNEELETGKEELQSTNEELMVVNHEMISLNEQVTTAKDYAEAIIVNIREPLLVLDENLKIKTANDAFYKTFRVTEKETEAVSIYDIGNKQWDIPALRTLLEKILPEKTVFNDFEVTHTFSSIGERVMLLNAREVINKKSSEKLILLSIEDITDLKKAEGVLRKTGDHFRHLVKELPAAVHSCDTQGRITFYNNAAIKIWGREPEPGKDLWTGAFKMFKSDGTPLPLENSPVAMAVRNGRAVHGEEIIIERPDGTRSIVLAYPQPEFSFSGEITGAINMAFDITGQKRIETELTEAIEFAEMATVIAVEAKSKAEEAVKAKQQFLSNMSHEIRTPMNAIIGFTKVMMKTELTEKQKEYLMAIKLSGDALIVLINDILDLAKVDAGKMTFEKVPFKMAMSVSAMLHLFDIKIKEKNLTLGAEVDSKIPEVLLGDPVRLHQIIINLVSNAVKFTSKGKISLNVRMVDEDEEKVTVEFIIADTGIGISPEKIATIFENFQQATSDTSRLYGGTGLGLAIVKKLIESQGGSITVASKLNKGSTFRFVLDFQKTTAAPEMDTEFIDLHTDIDTIKVLVVEDMSLNQLLMKTILDEFGFQRDIAANGKIAIEKLQTRSYDIILMDLQMPEMNGFEATAYIRNTLHSKIPIIALTADVTTVDLEKCNALGMNDYIAKPVDEKMLFNKIVSLVKKPVSRANNEKKTENKDKGNTVNYTNLSYLEQYAKSNPALIMEMIAIYLEQTPPLVNAMKQSFEQKNWQLLYAAVHKMIPSFSIMGLETKYETMAKKVQEYARNHTEADTANLPMQGHDGTTNQEEIADHILQIENICDQTCKELAPMLTQLKSKE